jgi:hypothetical protein
VIILQDARRWELNKEYKVPYTYMRKTPTDTKPKTRLKHTPRQQQTALIAKKNRPPIKQLSLYKNNLRHNLYTFNIAYSLY